MQSHRCPPCLLIFFPYALHETLGLILLEPYDIDLSHYIAIQGETPHYGKTEQLELFLQCHKQHHITALH